MSFVGVYKAIHPGSTLYSLLENEFSSRLIAHHLFSYGYSIYNLFDIESDESSEILEPLTEDMMLIFPEIFSSEESVKETIFQLNSAMIDACEDYPGIRNRSLVLDGTATDIINRLTPELVKQQVNNAEEIANKLFDGDKFFGDGDEDVDLIIIVSRQLVSEGVSILQQINPESLFSRDRRKDRLLFKDFEAFRNLYIEVNENNEEIIYTHT
jgi:hypothetical protein